MSSQRGHHKSVIRRNNSDQKNTEEKEQVIYYKSINMVGGDFQVVWWLKWNLLTLQVLKAD